MYKPLVELGRPESLEDLVVDEELYKVLTKLVSQYEIMPHLILAGPPGTGKTSAARVIANQILKKRTFFNYLQLNASSDRGVDTVRGQILSFVSNKSFMSIDTPDAPYKVIFLDEADALTPDAQNALRNMMQTYVGNCRFILSCNNYNKIIDPIKSRALKLQFDYICPNKIEQRLLKVVERQNLDYTPSQIKKACENSQGDFRMAYNKLGMDLKISDTDIKSFVNYLVNKSIDQTPAQVYTIVKLKKNIVEESNRLFFKQLCQQLASKNSNKTFSHLDRLAQAQSAIYSGANQLIQFMGWYGYYRNNQ